MTRHERDPDKREAWPADMTSSLGGLDADADIPELKHPPLCLHIRSRT